METDVAVVVAVEVVMEMQQTFENYDDNHLFHLLIGCDFLSWSVVHEEIHEETAVIDDNDYEDSYHCHVAVGYDDHIVVAN